MPEHIIDCDAPIAERYRNLIVLPDAEQLPNRVRGKFCWSQWPMGSVDLFRCCAQRGDGHQVGSQVYDEIRLQPVLTAHVLEFFLKPEYSLLFPDWKGWGTGSYFFWGTLYRDVDGQKCVRCLDRTYGGGRWSTGSWYRRLDKLFEKTDPAIVLATPDDSVFVR